MKKTLIALAVASSVVIPFSVMAWDVNGSGGSVNIGGSLTPAENITPWEVKTGAAVTGLDAEIQKGTTTINLLVKDAIPVLGIRSVNSGTFYGASQVNPQIDFNNAVDLDGFDSGKTTLSLDVMDKDGGNKIGRMTTKILTAAAANYKDESGYGKKFRVTSQTAGTGFFGGVAKNGDGMPPSPGQAAAKVFPEATQKYVVQEGLDSWSDPQEVLFNDPKATYSAYYASGIEAGEIINIVLDNPVAGDAPIHWKASLPVTVYYQ